MSIIYVWIGNEQLSAHVDGEPGDERLAQIMREVAEDARESTRRASERVAAGIAAATHEARARLEKTIANL